jgi:predicted HicB family RNase H-like nuclease
MPEDHVHVRIRRDLHHQAKVQAAVEGVSLEEWLARAIEAQLKRSRPR